MQWKRRVTIAMFNSHISSILSQPRAPHCGRYMKKILLSSLLISIIYTTAYSGNKSNYQEIKLTALAEYFAKISGGIVIAKKEVFTYFRRNKGTIFLPPIESKLNQTEIMWSKTFNAILSIHGYNVQKSGNIIIIHKKGEKINSSSFVWSEYKIMYNNLQHGAGTHLVDENTIIIHSTDKGLIKKLYEEHSKSVNHITKP
jgi:hypothetical protein